MFIEVQRLDDKSGDSYYINAEYIKHFHGCACGDYTDVELVDGTTICIAYEHDKLYKDLNKLKK